MPSFHTPGPLPHPNPSLSLPRSRLQRPGPQPPLAANPTGLLCLLLPHTRSVRGGGGGVLLSGPPPGPSPRPCSSSASPTTHSTLVSACPEITRCLWSRTCLSPGCRLPWGGSFPDLVHCCVRGPGLSPFSVDTAELLSSNCSHPTLSVQGRPSPDSEQLVGQNT